MKQILLILFWLLSGALTAQEICNNGSDDDSDGLVDCADGDCFSAGHCPTVFDQTPSVCEDTPGSGSATVDLTTYESSITGGLSHTIAWYQDTTVLGDPIILIATPSSYSVTNGDVVFAEVDNGPNQDIASVTFTVNSKPTASDQTPAVCEDAMGSGQAVVDLTTLESSINGDSGHTFSWFEDAGLTTPIADPTSYMASDGQTFYSVVDDGVCTNTATVTYTINSLEDAGFSYASTSYCENDTNPTPTAAYPGGIFSADPGLVINPVTGEVDIAASSPGTHTITHNLSGACASSSTFSMTISLLPDADFSYPATIYCPTDANPTPTPTTPGGTFSSLSGLVMNTSTGEIDLASSPAGDHTITYTVSGICQDSETFDIALIDANAPVAQAATDITCDAFTAVWDSVFSATSYEVDVASDASFSSLLASYNAAPTTDTFLTVTGLNAATTYYYRVRALTSCGTSLSSNTITLGVLDLPATAVTNLTASNPDCNGFKVSWDAVTYASGYLLEVSQDGFTTLDFSVSIPSTSLTLATLSKGTTYEFRVIPQNVCGTGPSATNSYQTNDVPAPPINVMASEIVCDGVTLSWDEVIEADQYLVEISTDTFATFSTYPVSNDTLLLSGLIPATAYSYRIIPTNTCGAGDTTAVMTFATDSLPASPINVQLVADHDQVSVVWDTIINANTYQVEIASDVLFSSLISTVTVESTNAIATGLTPLTTYYGRVLADNSCGTGPASDTLLFTTPQDSLVTDSLALVDLYNATDGPNWTDDTNWLNGPISSWQGVITEDQRVTRLELSQNQLSGTFPPTMSDLTALVYADFRDNQVSGSLGDWISRFQEATDSLRISDNQLTDIVSGMPFTLGVIEVDHNQLTFADLLPIVGVLPQLTYAPQSLIGSTSTTYRTAGGSYTLSLGIDAPVTDNQYIWFRDGIAVDTTITNQYVMNPIINGDAGVYTCHVTNPGVPGLVLESRPMTVQVEPLPNSLTFSPVADVIYGSEPFVLNATATSGLPAHFEAIEGDSLVIVQGDMVTPIGVGKVTIRATQPGDDFYGAATPRTQQFSISRGSQTISFTAINDQDLALTDSLLLIISASSGLPVEFTIEGPAELEDSVLILLDTGTVTVTATQSGNLYYEPALPVSQSFLVYTSDTLPDTENPPGQTDALFTVTVQLSDISSSKEVSASLHVAEGSSFVVEQQQLMNSGGGQFREVSEGFYTLRFAPADDVYLPTYAGNQLTLAQASVLSLSRDTTLTVSLLFKPDTTAQRGVMVKGSLQLETAGGRVSENVALADIPVYLVYTNDGTIAGYGTTDDTGAFVFPNIPPGSYYFLADYEGIDLQNNQLEVTDLPLELLAVVHQHIELRSIEEIPPTGLITGIGESHEMVISAYPNPTSDKLTIKIPSQWAGSDLTIMDVSGKQMVSTSLTPGNTTLSLTSLPAGLYYLRLQNGSQSYAMKLVKE